MRICLQVLAYNVSNSINAMLKNAADHVDKIYIAYPSRAWDYHRDFMNTTNPRKLGEINTSLNCDVEIIKGEWRKDEHTRNALLEKARHDKFDWMIIQDADEFYTLYSWSRLKAILFGEKCTSADSIQVPYLTFWKSPSFVLEGNQEGIKNGTTTFAINCNNEKLHFSYSRTTTAKRQLYIDEPCYHYSYVLSDSEIKQKLSSWAHSNDLLSKRLWYHLKWRHWHPGSKMLHPGSPWLWTRAVRFPLPQPSFVGELNFSEPTQKDINLFWAILDFLYNAKARIDQFINGLKRVIRATFLSSI